MKTDAVEILRERYIGDDEERLELFHEECMKAKGPDEVSIKLHYTDDRGAYTIVMQFHNFYKIESLKHDKGLLGELVRGEF